MKLRTIVLATVFALPSTLALAQTGYGSTVAPSVGSYVAPSVGSTVNETPRGARLAPQPPCLAQVLPVTLPGALWLPCVRQANQRQLPWVRPTGESQERPRI
jgi:hypothetical protein